jgi:hypothetical protein
MDMPARLTYPDDRIDATRGCVAIERGPLVYCLEQTDQAPEAGVDNLAIAADAKLISRPVDDPLLGRTVFIEAEAVELVRPPVRGLPYHSLRNANERLPARIRAVPYFLWDNRDGGPMRVWIPLDVNVPTVRTPIGQRLVKA